MLATPREKPSLQLLSFGINTQKRLSLIAGMHNLSARQHSTYTVNTELLKTKPDFLWYFEHQSNEKIYRHIFPVNNEGLRRALFSERLDGVIWITDGLLPGENTAQLGILRRCGAELLVFFEVPDLPEDELDIIEQDLREHCNRAGFIGDEVKILRGKASSEESIRELAEACDQVFYPKVESAGAFFMPIEDVFSIQRKGVVVTGRVERGKIKVGDEIEIVGIRPTKKTIITAIEAFRQGKNFAEAGQNVGVMLRDLQKGDVERGQSIAKPGSITVSDSFEAEVYFYPPDKGSQYLLDPGQSFSVVFYTWRGEAVLTAGELRHDEITSVSIRTKMQLAAELFTRFAVVVGGRSAGIGLVTKIL